MCANIDWSLRPELEGVLQKSVVLEVGGQQIGIVGYVTLRTAILVDPGLFQLAHKMDI